MSVAGCAASVALVIALATSGVARAQENDRELQARTHYAAGDYKQALDIYAALYAETLHPTYLRNIGRCYQNMGEPDRAITSFKEYLRKAKLDANQRSEIEGYIKEMEALKAGREKGEPPARPTPAPEVPRSTLPRAEPPAGERAGGTPPGATLTLTSTPTEPRRDAGDDENRPAYGRWWFWAIVGAVAAGGVTTAFLLSRPAATPTEATTLGTMRAPL
jgi:tetratricopeptide (TPR) repeat protein